VTAGELQKLGAETIQELQLVQGLTDQVQLLGIVSAADNRDRLTRELAAADAVYTSAVQAAVGRSGDWASVQVAGERVRECRAALKAAA
jgi:hypothetical protein